ncbi:hypothetical protein GCM10023187_50670 [Nibrella viscosa]|uniref:Uncharacterized protein n=2 Tax=Nibrella viscosa TaxID=1084524 RepID=A0ABP8KWY6_9BACT
MLNTGRAISRIMGLWGALLLVFLPLVSADAEPLAERQTYLSAYPRQRSCRFSDAQIQPPMALLNFRLSTPVFSSAAFLPVIPTAIYRLFTRLWFLLHYRPFFSLAFLRALLEHQIAINAP